MATKTAQIIEILQSNESVTGREIAKRVGCTEGYVSMVKNKIKTAPEADETPKDEPETVTDPSNDELESETSSFVKKIKIEPDKRVLTDNGDDEVKTEDYECGVCGHAWQAEANEYQHRCPGCGEAF